MQEIPLAPALAELIRRAEEIRASEDPEGPHGLRVATRRIDVWLRLGGRRTLRPDLRWLRAVAGKVRDADVVLAAARPTAALRADRAEARAALLTVLGSDRFGGLCAGLAVQPPVAADEARARLRSLVRAAIRTRPRSPEEVHALRRRLRRVRYALEWLGEPLGPLVPLQDVLGSVSDRSLHDTDGATEDDVRIGRRAWKEATSFLAERG